MVTSSKRSDRVVDAFLSAANFKQHQGKWIASSAWAGLINAYACLDFGKDPVTASELNQTISRSSKLKHVIGNLHETNDIGIYRNNVAGKNGRVTFYMSTRTSDLSVIDPKNGRKWYQEKVVKQNPVRGHDASHAAPSQERKSNRQPAQQQQEQTSPKVAMSPPRLKRDRPQQNQTPRRGAKQKQRKRTNKKANSILTESFWIQGEAKRIFGVDKDGSVYGAVVERLEVLKQVAASHDGWKAAVDGGDKEDLFSDYQIWCIQQCCFYLGSALEYALENMDNGHKRWRWIDCCRKTAHEFEHRGCSLATHEKTIMKWHITFKKNNKFPNPNPSMNSLKARLPPIFQSFPDAVNDFCKHADENLSELRGELMLEFCVEKLMPNLLEQFNTTAKQHKEKQLDRTEFMKQYGIRNLCISSLFLFDHSCGHDRKRDDGLNYNDMNKGFGGKQPQMRSSLIERADGYLGPFDHTKKLKVGESQTMIFSENDEGPF